MAYFFFTESSPNLGGQELQLLQQASALRAMGHEILILCRPGSRISERARQQRLGVAHLPFRNALDFMTLWRLIGLLRKYRPRAVVCHSGHDSNASAIAVRLLSKLRLLKPRPALVRIKTYLSGAAKAFTTNQLFDLTLTPSQALRLQLLENPEISSQKVKVLYPGVDFSKLEKEAAMPLPADVLVALGKPGRPIIAHAAMLRGEKGHAFMLSILPRLIELHPSLLYVIAGEGPMRAELERKVLELDLKENVAFVGLLNPVSPLMAVASVVVMPSVYEPLGMSQIEALGLGIPVVVSDTGGLPETVKHQRTGWVCRVPGHPLAVDQWTEAINACLSDRSLAVSYAQLGKETSIGRFDAQKNIETFLREISVLPQ